MLIEPDNITIVFVPRVTNLNNIIVSIEFCIHLNFSAHTIKQNSRTFFPRSYTTYTRILWIHPQGRLLQSYFFQRTLLRTNHRMFYLNLDPHIYHWKEKVFVSLVKTIP